MNRKTIIASLIMLAGLATAQELSVELMDEPVIKAPLLPTTKPGEVFWQNRDPVGLVASLNITSHIWLAASPTGCRFHIEVDDPKHDNDFRAHDLWRGDAIYISLDGRGDTSTNDLANGIFGNDDAIYIFALCAEGAVGRVSRHGRPPVDRDASSMIKGLRRDEKRRTTIYDILVPWEALNTAPGFSASLAVAVHIAHKNSEGQDSHWGRMRKTKEGSRDLHRFRVPLDPNPFIRIFPIKTRIGSPEQNALFMIAVNGDDPVDIRTVHQRQRATLRFEDPGGCRRFHVRLPGPLISPAAAALDITVRTGQLSQEQRYQLATPEVALQRLRARIALLRETAPHELVHRHLDSTLRVIEGVYANLALETEDYPDMPMTFIDVVEMILGKLPADRFDWKRHLRTGLPLVFTFISDYDRTLQFYALQMPYGWDPEKTYPLTVYLHGAVGKNTKPLNGLSTAFDCTHQDTLFNEDPIDPEHIPPSHRGFVLAPWARANSMYHGVGESDVWKSLEQVRKAFKIDADRMYLTGFSMGCHGAWALAARTPDLWAGVNTASGFGPWSDTALDYLADNAHDLPVMIWVGELDKRMLDSAHAFHALLNEKKIRNKLTVLENVPHTYPYDQFQACVGWLMRYTREKPTAFSYISDSYQHQGRNGISLPAFQRNTPREKMPRFTCKIEGQTIHLNTWNTKEVVVKLGEKGLGLAGEATVIWNGKPAYQGPVKDLELELKTE